jgi:hypothetical protein
LTDQLDLFAVPADAKGYNCEALLAAMDQKLDGCCLWCHKNGDRWAVTFEEVKYISCCEHIYEIKLNNCGIRLVR